MAYSEKENLAKVAAGYRGGDFFNAPAALPKFKIVYPAERTGLENSNQPPKPDQKL